MSASSLEEFKATGWGFEQPGVVENAPAHSRRLELDDLKVTSNPNISMIL